MTTLLVIILTHIYCTILRLEIAEGEDQTIMIMNNKTITTALLVLLIVRLIFVIYQWPQTVWVSCQDQMRALT